MGRDTGSSSKTPHEYNQARYTRKREFILAQNAAWREANHEKQMALIRRWRENNRGRIAESVRFRQARKRNATPPWLTPEHREEMRRIYIDAAAIGAHVDHVVPLVGKTVCGLHVPWNLQILSPVENMRKGNGITE